MKYLGGKTRLAKTIAEIATELCPAGSAVWDAFCGGSSVSMALAKAGFSVLATDAHPALIALYQAVMQGWDPPSVITEADYAAARCLPDSDPFKAFAGFGCSFGGKYFGGFARSKGRNYARECRDSLLKLRGLDITFDCFDFLSKDAVNIASECSLVYCDPPYRGTTGYSIPFDSARFDTQAIAVSGSTHVLVSEYSFPHGQLILEKQQASTVSRDKVHKPRAERIYLIEKGTEQ